MPSPFVFMMQEISPGDISGITTKAPYGAALMNERHARIEITGLLCALLPGQKHCKAGQPIAT